MGKLQRDNEKVFYFLYPAAQTCKIGAKILLTRNPKCAIFLNATQAFQNWNTLNHCRPTVKSVFHHEFYIYNCTLHCFFIELFSTVLFFLKLIIFVWLKREWLNWYFRPHCRMYKHSLIQPYQIDIITIWQQYLIVSSVLFVLLCESSNFESFICVILLKPILKLVDRFREANNDRCSHF